MASINTGARPLLKPVIKPVIAVVLAIWVAYFFTQQRTVRQQRLDQIRSSYSESIGVQRYPHPGEWVPPVIPRYPVPAANPLTEERDNAEYRMRRARSSALIW